MDRATESRQDALKQAGGYMGIPGVAKVKFNAPLTLSAGVLFGAGREHNGPVRFFAEGIMRFWLLMALLAAPGLAAAQTYKCNIGGKFVYSDAPCSGLGSRVDAGGPDQRAEIEALRRALSEKQQLQRIERQKAADDARFNAEAAAVAAEDRRAAQARASRCNAAQSDKAYNDRRVARYQDWGWQNSQNQARAEREAAERRMRDHCD